MDRNLETGFLSNLFTLFYILNWKIIKWVEKAKKLGKKSLLLMAVMQRCSRFV